MSTAERGLMCMQVQAACQQATYCIKDSRHRQQLYHDAPVYYKELGRTQQGRPMRRIKVSPPPAGGRRSQAAAARRRRCCRPAASSRQTCRPPLPRIHPRPRPPLHGRIPRWISPQAAGDSVRSDPSTNPGNRCLQPSFKRSCPVWLVGKAMVQDTRSCSWRLPRAYGCQQAYMRERKEGSAPNTLHSDRLSGLYG
jgi:hypothetical protein